MADNVEVHAPLPGGNGERLELRVGTKSLGISAKDLVSFGVVILLGGLIYFMANNITTGQDRGFASLAKILEHMGANQQQTLDRLSQNQQVMLELVHTNRSQMMTELSKQNEQVSGQTAALQAAVDAQTAALRKMLITINWNMGRDPNERIPLEMMPGDMSKPAQGR